MTDPAPVGIIGAGNIGGALATLLAAAGHPVLVSSRNPDSIQDLAGGPGGRIRVGTPDEAAAFGDVVVEAVPFGNHRDLPAARLAGKIVVSASNYYPQRDGEHDLGGRVDTELVAEHLRGARVVKAFNTIWSKHLETQGDTTKAVDARRAIPLAGDDAGAKEVVADLIRSIGFTPVDTGSLHAGGLLQDTTSAIYNQDLTAPQVREALSRA